MYYTYVLFLKLLEMGMSTLELKVYVLILGPALP